MIDKTLPQLLVEKAKTIGHKVALREKDYGIWQEWTWQSYLEEVKAFSMGLACMGFARGDKLAIVGDNRPEWVISELSAQSLGGVSVGIYQDSLPKEIAYVLNHSDAKFVVVEDQEQVDKLLEVEEEIPHIQKIIYYDPKGLRHYHHPRLMSFLEVKDLGETFSLEHPDYYIEQVELGKSSDVAILCYTSGTTGFPKGAMLTHQNLVNMGESLMSMDSVETDDEFLSFLPLAWIGEQMMAISASLVVGFTVNFPEEPTTVQENLREIGPHMIFSPPRIWEDMVSKIQVRIQDSSWIKRKLYELFMPYGMKRADAVLEKKKLSLWEKWMYRLGDYLIFSAIKDHLGLLRIKWAYTGGAALGPDISKFFHSLGVNLKQIYGQTEVAGIAVVHRDGDIKFDSVGVPIPGTEIKISEKGEILIKSPSVFVGYYKNETATEETIDNGWLRTGDAGFIDDDGHLMVIDRLKDVIRLHSGELFSPQFIENKLKFSPYIKEAVAIGQDRPYVVAMINIDMANVGRWAEVNQIAYTTYTDLSQKPEVLDLIQKEIVRINLELPEKARIKKFVLLYKELDADDEELTRTRKVRRAFVAEKYKPVIEGLYSASDEIHVEGKVRYRDGKETIIRTNLKVMDLDGEVA
ncbi:AMP-binding protein [Microaerobacter geothermalis]|uniref:AMP-binding protein n=1 Tax=Microaerobacter geothermalis TaxID=674972 RepID=UPI001F46ED94|nr:AMP-binding protein [Microaerobacter geothermalis]MCF6095006.1 AMP-binding protein [Microaerobacter geothermalis]